jgi:DNA repair protein RecN (Recombination protein N)
VLVELCVSHIALVESARIPLTEGFTVWTGETGAGKSILLDAIGLVTGKRGGADFIRTGSDSGRVDALFRVPAGSPALNLLEQWGIPVEDGELVISRELHRSGRSVCRINGRTVTVQMLRELGMYLVQQQGQHDDVGLMRAEEQLHLLDLYGRHDTLLAEVRRLYEAWSDARDELEKARIQEQERARRLDMLAFQIEEIERAELQPGEEENLREERQRLLHAGRILEAVQEALQSLQDTGGALDSLGTAVRKVSAAAEHDRALQSSLQLLETAEVHVQEAVHDLTRYLRGLDADPARLEAVESRLQQIRTLERKYGSSIEEVLRYLEEAKQERDRWLHHEEHVQSLTDRLARLEQELDDATRRLHEARSRAAKRLAGEVQRVLRLLHMPRARFEVEVAWRPSKAGNRPQFGPTGADVVTFLFSANPGEPPKPLSRVASGGELSRTLLAVKSALAEVDQVPTLVFDEIDAGVSGNAAAAVAAQMRSLSRHHQVLCVTHSPQIAAAANSHYLIEKVEADERTMTVVRQLDEDGRIAEIARLIGTGEGDASTALRHAQALLESYRASA